jgi:hypothetical protein
VTAMVAALLWCAAAHAASAPVAALQVGLRAHGAYVDPESALSSGLAALRIPRSIASTR